MIRPNPNMMANALRIVAVIYVIASVVTLLGPHILHRVSSDNVFLLILNYCVVFGRDFIILVGSFAVAHLLERT